MSTSIFPSSSRRFTESAVVGAALAMFAAGCSSHSTPDSASTSSSPATRIVAYPVRAGTYRLVNKADEPVAETTKDLKFPQSFSIAAVARDGYYLPGQARHQIVYLIAGQLARGVSPSAPVGDYLSEFQGQEVHLTAEPAGPLGGVVKCWESGVVTFCMWADGGGAVGGTFGVFNYEPPLGLDTVLIHHKPGLLAPEPDRGVPVSSMPQRQAGEGRTGPPRLRSPGSAGARQARAPSRRQPPGYGAHTAAG